MLLQGGGGVMWDLPNCGGRYLARNDAQPAEEHRRQHPEVGNTYQKLHPKVCNREGLMGVGDRVASVIMLTLQRCPAPMLTQLV